MRNINETDELRKIIESKVDGAQAVMMVCNPIYVKLENSSWYAACEGQEWVQVTDKQIGIMRSLSDIEKIIELEDGRISLIAELEQEGQSLESLIK